MYFNRMGWRQLFFAIICILSFTSSSNAQDIESVLSGFKKLHARLEVGIIYPDYLKILGEINYELKKFDESRDHPADGFDLMLIFYSTVKLIV